MGRAFWVWLWSLGVAVGLVGCTRCESRRELEFYVEGVPHTLADAEDLDDPPDVVVAVKKGSKQGGGGAACGHSPACIILVPFIVGDAMFPSHYKLVTVEENGKLTFSGMYKQNGELVRGMVTRDGVARKVGVLTLSALGRAVVVEVEHAPLGTDGKPGKFTPSSIQKQVDLLSDYEKALKQRQQGRAALLTEALSVLDHEAVGMAAKHLGDREEPSDTKSGVMHWLCSPRTTPKQPEPASKRADRKALLEALVRGEPDARAALEALGCVDDPASPLGRKLMARVLPAACQGKGDVQIARDLFRWIKQETAPRLPKPGSDARADAARKVLEPLAARCDNPTLTRLVKFWLREPQPREVLVELVSEPRVVSHAQLVADFDPDDEDDREILLEAMQRRRSEAIASRLEKAQQPPGALEQQVLLDVYAEPGDDQRPRLRALTLSRLRAASEHAAVRAALARRLGDEPELEPARLAARVALGDASAQPALFRIAVDSYCQLEEALSTSPSASGEPGAASTPSGSAVPGASASAAPPSASAAPGSSASARPLAIGPASPGPRHSTREACMRYYPLRENPRAVYQPEHVWAYAFGVAGCQREEMARAARLLDERRELEPPICAGE